MADTATSTIVNPDVDPSKVTEKELRDRIDAQRARVKDLAEGQKAAVNAAPIEDGVVKMSVEQAKDVQDVVGEIRDLTESTKALEGLLAALEWGNAPTQESTAVQAESELAGSGSGPKRGSRKSLGQQFVDSEEFKELVASGSFKMDRAFKYEGAISGAGAKDIYDTLPSGTPDEFGDVQRLGIVDRARRSFRLRDLFGTRQTTAAVIEFFRVTGLTNAASTVGQYSGGSFVAKPQSSISFEGRQSPVRTIAHWEAAHRNVLADEAQLRSIINTELPYGLQLEEDNQILNGSGTGNDLSGILQDSDVQTYSWSSGETTPVDDTRADALRRAMTLAFLAFYEPTGIVLHPTNWEQVELTKSETEGNYLVALAVAVGAQQRLWRVPVVETPAITEDTALVGSFGLGAHLYDREEANIRVTDSHEDFFIRNAIVVLAEERLALTIPRPESFVNVTFDAAP